MNILSNILKLELNDLNNKYKIKNYTNNIINYIRVINNIIYTYNKDKYLNCIQLHDPNYKIYFQYKFNLNGIEYYEIPFKLWKY